MRAHPVLRALIPAVLFAIGCGRAHDLGVDTTSSSSSSGSGGSSTSSSTSTTSTASTTTGSGGADAGPLGPTELTVVNGVADYPAARLCFLPGETPWPADVSGLAFAAGKTVDLATAIPGGTDIVAWVVAGDLSVTAGKTCTEILALAQPPPMDGGSDMDGGLDMDAGTLDASAPAAPVVAVQLGAIPQAVLASGRSLLLVASGCMGGAGHDNASAAIACGSSYTSASPTTTAVLVGMSRIVDSSHVSLQAVNASPGIAPLDLRVVPSPMGSSELGVASSLFQGSIGPMPPFHQLAVGDYGALPGVQLRTYVNGGSSAAASASLGDVLSASAVGMAGFTNGASLVLVGVGAPPTAPGGGFWHAFTYAVVKADPQ